MRPLFTLILCLAAAGDARGEPVLRTATRHPMQYYLALPRGFTPDKKWPILVVVEAAEKQFKLNAERFERARGDLPFIIVAPIIVTSGRAGQRDPAIYPYSVDTWDRIDRDGVCGFDLDGLAGVVEDVQRSFAGEERFFITGFEAGAHLVWAMALLHPERLRAAAPVAGNYIGRCVDEAAISRDPARARLPIRGIAGAADRDWAPGGGLHAQWERARALAAAHGFADVTETLVPGKAHVPLPEAVLAALAPLVRP